MSRIPNTAWQAVAVCTYKYKVTFVISEQGILSYIADFRMPQTLFHAEEKRQVFSIIFCIHIIGSKWLKWRKESKILS